MKITQQNLGEQLRITALEIARRKELFGITPDDEALLAQAKDTVERDLGNIVDEFYESQIQAPEIEQLIGDAETLARLKKHMAHYLLALFGGLYDDIYVLSRLRVGLVHNRIGVSPKLYVPAVRMLLDILRARLGGPAAGGECAACLPVMRALEKVLLFDLSLVFDTYIHALVGQVERGKAELETYAQGLEQEVAKRTQQLSEQASHDPLTGLPNRRSLFESLRREISLATRRGQPLTMAYMDLDGFKAVNDSLGHKEGDRVLQALAGALKATLRAEDLPARVGGDEFCAVLPNVGLKAAREVAARLFKAFEARRATPGGQDLAVTVSMGLAALDLAAPQAPETLARQADEAMYRAKKITGHAVVQAGGGDAAKG